MIWLYLESNRSQPYQWHIFYLTRLTKLSRATFFQLIFCRCVSKTNEAKTTSPETQEPFQPSSQVATVTISVVLPPLSTNNTYQLSSQEISEELVAAYEKVLNTTSNSSINIQTTGRRRKIIMKTYFGCLWEEISFRTL